MIICFKRRNMRGEPYLTVNIIYGCEPSPRSWLVSISVEKDGVFAAGKARSRPWTVAWACSCHVRRHNSPVDLYNDDDREDMLLLEVDGRWEMDGKINDTCRLNLGLSDPNLFITNSSLTTSRHYLHFQPDSTLSFTLNFFACILSQRQPQARNGEVPANSTSQEKSLISWKSVPDGSGSVIGRYLVLDVSN